MDSFRTSATGFAWIFMAVPSADVVERDVEHVVVSQLSCRHHDFAVGDHWYRLLCQSTMRAQRLGQAGEIMPRAARAQHFVNGGECHDIADAIRRQVEALAGFV